jgi:hypothetical protein
MYGQKSALASDNPSAGIAAKMLNNDGDENKGKMTACCLLGIERECVS